MDKRRERALWGILAAAGVVAIVVPVLLVLAFFRSVARPGTPQEPAVDLRSLVLERIEHVNKQVLVEHYNAAEVYYGEAPQSWLKLFLRQDIVVLVRGTVPAGFDLQKVTREDIWISRDGTRVQLTLPPPQVFEENVAIDLENSKILRRRDTCPFFICKDSLEAYQGIVLPEGKLYLVDLAIENGILEQAADDGLAYYEELLKALGFAQVRVVVTGYAP